MLRPLKGINKEYTAMCSINVFLFVRLWTPHVLCVNWTSDSSPKTVYIDSWECLELISDRLLQKISAAFELNQQTYEKEKKTKVGQIIWFEKNKI